MQQPPYPEKELFAQIANGDEKAFEKLFRLFYPMLVNFAMKYLNDREIAENVVQEMFVSIWEKRGALKVDNPRAYLMRAVTNRCFNEMKSKKTFYDVDDFQIPEVDQDIPDESLIAEVQSVISMLPEQRQKIFRMSRFEGMKYKEIAERLNLSVKTVEAQMGKALQFLREQLPKKIKESGKGFPN
ncbi:RNA polymerase sigma-70 factor [Natronoflexus pectinivorans]|uniref:RNA polymerase sigma-70 factor (ECF subfamily) n=1 Tax=Natronoflexus pectinivorans TaxID=682526 RepID=A0A4R2GME5_9BACT|nr:RNA polymerase sigma-70 factor [Natronoflexus pectinivorans]TCO09888.1 RNA polymerase sigma-70 factor (ECF subfamily) [Natronoflexus pectinivorans]